MVGPGSVQDVLVLLDLTLRPFPVSRTTVLGDGREHTEQTEGSHGLLVQHVQLVADGGHGHPGSGGQHGRLGHQRVTGQRVHNRLGLLLGVLRRHVGVETGGCQVGRDGPDVARGKGRPKPGSTYFSTGSVHTPSPQQTKVPAFDTGNKQSVHNIPTAVLVNLEAIVQQCSVTRENNLLCGG